MASVVRTGAGLCGFLMGDWYTSSTPMPYFTVWTDVNINTYLYDTDKQCMTYQQ